MVDKIILFQAGCGGTHCNPSPGKVEVEKQVKVQGQPGLNGLSEASHRTFIQLLLEPSAWLPSWAHHQPSITNQSLSGPFLPSLSLGPLSRVLPSFPLCSKVLLIESSWGWPRALLPWPHPPALLSPKYTHTVVSPPALWFFSSPWSPPRITPVTLCPSS